MAIFFIFIPNYNKINFFVNGIIKGCSQENRILKKKSTKPMKKNYKKDRRSIIKTLLEMRKLKKEVILTIEIKMCQMKIEKERNI